MPEEPNKKRTVVFFDGQNLYHSAKRAFGYHYPNYDVLALARVVCDQKSWELVQARFYTGVARYDPFWHHFWDAKLLGMARQGVIVHPFNIKPRPYTCPSCGVKSDGKAEKCTDVRMALDIVRMAHNETYDVAVIFSQDQDLSEVPLGIIEEVVEKKNRWLKIACAFPHSNILDKAHRRGIDKTDWIPISKNVYDTCIDPRHYGPRKTGTVQKQQKTKETGSSVISLPASVWRDN